MIYAKTTANGISQKIPLSELPLFCKCPGCGAEVQTDVYDMLEATAGFEDFDPDAFGVYCDHCQEEMNTIREHLSGMDVEETIDGMPLDKLKQLCDLTLPYLQYKK